MSKAARTLREQTSGPRLPRGPHSLTREQVAADQRRRLMAALTDVVADKGYTAATVADVSARAGVSRKAFYEHFANKEACLLETYDEIVAAGMRRIARIYGELDGLSAGARASIGALFELAIENPNVLPSDLPASPGTSGCSPATKSSCARASISRPPPARSPTRCCERSSAG
jgi:AcrR family transcriptional regulator